MSGYVGRLAPSPTGALHLGNVRTFMIAWLRARQAHGRVVMRIEDLDHPRHKEGAAEQAIDDLRWLGFDWDEVHVQSERRGLYATAIDTLVERGLAYPCVCTRSDVEAVQSAPHEGEQLHYPGTCRGRFQTWRQAASFIAANEDVRRQPCWRFRTPDGARVEFVDGFAGRYSMDVSSRLGDFPLARDEHGAGYAIAVVVDDAAMGVTEVVRGDDLLPATPPQMLIYDALGLRCPAFFHVPLVVGPDGRRLAKRHGDTRISAYRAAGVSPGEIIGFLAHASGILCKRKPTRLDSLIGRFDPACLPQEPLVYQGFT